MYIRFAIGEVPGEHQQSIAEEEEKHGAFLRIPLQVGQAIGHPHPEAVAGFHHHRQPWRSSALACPCCGAMHAYDAAHAGLTQVHSSMCASP